MSLSVYIVCIRVLHIDINSPFIRQSADHRKPKHFLTTNCTTSKLCTDKKRTKTNQNMMELTLLKAN